MSASVGAAGVPASVDVIVVGSGPGGAWTAAELARRGARVALFEAARRRPLRGTLPDMLRMAGVPGRSVFVARDGSALFRGLGVGGTTLVNYATAMPPPLDRFRALGIDLAPALAAVTRALAPAPLPDALVGPMARRIEAAAGRLALPWQRFAKFIDASRCRRGCWRCTYGCPFGAKWSARQAVDDAVAAGASLIDGATVHGVRVRGGRVVGVDYRRDGQAGGCSAATVVLAAGGIGSPRLLTRAGVAPSAGLFVDPVVAAMGIVGDLDAPGGAEVPMVGGVLADDGVMLADMTLPPALFRAFAVEAGHVRLAFAHRRALTVMVKFPDALGGTLGRRWVDRPLAAAERRRLDAGIERATALLQAAGAKAVRCSRPFAAHPGGSAALGTVVDARLETPVQGLYVCDASVLPAPWGRPPTLTLLCLAQDLAGRLAT